ncbi:MAG: hypothetical protein A2W37_07755 [Chloroflexi bacterium RBG_16_63_12]|nr:MAG: hypothetical protein A2W37_07755 [Chloroflexi bacterium RBG_16_63_12]
MPTEKLPTYGGQAVLEGVMMRGVQTMAIAVRAPDQQIILHSQPLDAQRRGRLMRIPFVRGLVGLWDALALGWKSLSFSASIASGEQVKFEGPLAWVTMAISLTLGVGLFFLAPAALSQLVERVLGINPSFGSLLEGLVRLGLITGYLWLIGFLPDVHRLFGYHGAEHKTINAFEAGAELTPASVVRFPLEHPRCGTAFLLTVVVFSILLFALLGPMPVWARLLSRVLLIPVVAGLAFEYIRFTARHLSHPLVKLLVVPNLALQRLTTREPDARMLEVAIAAFNAMREKENVTVV